MKATIYPTDPGVIKQGLLEKSTIYRWFPSLKSAFLGISRPATLDDTGGYSTPIPLKNARFEMWKNHKNIAIFLK